MYVEPRGLIERFGANEISELMGTPDQPPDENDARLVAACQDATAIADGYLARAVKLPLQLVPFAVVAVTADIARYRLHDDQTFEGGQQGKSTQRMRYEDAIKWLESVADGRTALFADVGQNSDDLDTPYPLKANSRIAVVASPVVFDQKTLEKMDAVRRR